MPNSYSDVQDDEQAEDVPDNETSEAPPDYRTPSGNPYAQEAARQEPPLPVIYNRAEGPPDQFGQYPYVRQETPPLTQEQAQALIAGRDPDESSDEKLMRIQRRLGQLSLSPAENIRLQRYDNQRSAIQEGVDTGRFSPQEGQDMMQQIDQMAAPLMVRRSEVPLWRERAQWLMTQRQMARQEALDHQNAAFRSRTAQDRLQSVTLDDGTTAHFIEDRTGRMQPVSNPHAAQEDRQRTHIEDSVRRELNSFVTRSARRAGETDAQYDARVDSLRPPWLPPPPPNETPEQRRSRVQEAIRNETAARAPGGQAGQQPQQSGQDSIEQLRNNFATEYNGRTWLQRHSGGLTAPETQAIGEAHDLLMAAQQRGNGSLTTAENARFQQIIGRLPHDLAQRLLGNRQAGSLLSPPDQQGNAAIDRAVAAATQAQR